MYNFERVGTNEQAIQQASQLLVDVFGRPELFTKEYVKWQYADNPAGNIVGFNAMAGEDFAAHYVTQPFYGLMEGQKVKGLLSLNTATADNHRGKGLFTQLAQKTYEAAANEGYSFVIGVANQNSVGGFVKKLGFQLVSQLDALIGVGSLSLPQPKNDILYERYWDKELLDWRLAHPTSQYFTKKYLQHKGVYSATAYPMVHANLGFFPEEIVSSPKVIEKSPSPFKLWLGKDCRMSYKGKLYFDIPQKLRPSPLMLIYLDLTGKRPTIDANELVFQAIDFDAY